MISTKDVSIVLLTKNGGELFADVLAGLFRCDGIEEAEVLMIDSGSTDQTLSIAAKYKNLRVHQIPPSEFGHGKTRNLGARLTSRPILVFLVHDATPANPAFLRNLVAPLANENVAGVFGRQLARPATNRIEKLFLAETYPDTRAVRKKKRSDQETTTISDIFFSNVCSAMRRSVWEQIPFDESLIMSEDQKWAKEAVLAGFELVYEPTAEVVHSHNYRLKEVFKRNFDSGVSLVGITEDTPANMVAYELRHVLFGVGELVRSGDAAQIPYFFVYEATRVAAFACGQRAHLLPHRIKRAFSLHKYHWNRAGG